MIKVGDRMTNMVYRIVTNKIIEKLRSGSIAWEKPWIGDGCGTFNRISNKQYSFLNQLLLNHTGEYATERQWLSLGGEIRESEKPEIVTFWKMCKKKQNNAEEINTENHDFTNIEGEKNRFPVLRYYKVFHISQVYGVDPLPLRRFENKLDGKIDSYIERYLEREDIEFVQKRIDRAYYEIGSDRIVLPLLEQFKSSGHYYETILHEIVHSTGSHGRLNRFSNGKEEYSREELVAEIGCAFLMSSFGIESDRSLRNNVAYIESWISSLQNDEKLIVYASSKAEKAIKFILGENFK